MPLWILATLAIVGAVLLLACTGGFLRWLMYVATCLGKVVVKLESFEEKLGGLVDWIKKHDDKLDAHAKLIGDNTNRIAHLESQETQDA